MTATRPRPDTAIPGTEPPRTNERSVYLRALHGHQAGLGPLALLGPVVEEAGQRLAACLAAGGKVLIVGLGASLGLSQHLALAMVGRAGQTRAPLAALALHAQVEEGSNGPQLGFARQLQALGRPGDALVLISAGEACEAMQRVADEASEMGLLTVGLLAPGSATLAENCHLAITVPGDTEAQVHEAQQFVCHALWAVIQAEQQ
jgi:D-sedoheptulose 7-phosphate isomerase